MFSSRQFERNTYGSVAFCFIAANTHPDHNSIATFRRRFLPQLCELFVQILQIAHQMKLLKLGNVSLDGSKIKANASKHKALRYEYAIRLEAQIKDEVTELLRKAESADRADIPDGMNIPKELELREKRLSVIAAARPRSRNELPNIMLANRRPMRKGLPSGPRKSIFKQYW